MIPKLKLTYRVGYYADDPDGLAGQEERAHPRVHHACRGRPRYLDANHCACGPPCSFGAPEPTQIVMKIRVVPAGSKPEDTVADSNVPDSKAHGPVSTLRRSITLRMRGTSSSCPTPTEPFKISLEFAVLVYDDQGKPFTTPITQDSRGRQHYCGKEGQRCPRAACSFTRRSAFPSRVNYYMRAGIHDRINDAMGAVEMDVNDVRGAAEKAAAALAKAAAARQSCSVYRSQARRPARNPRGPDSLNFENRRSRVSNVPTISIAVRCRRRPPDRATGRPSAERPLRRLRPESLSR